MTTLNSRSSPLPVRAMAILALALAAPLYTQAQNNIPPSITHPNPAQTNPPRHHRPPRPAIIACDGKAVGAACSFADREGKQLSGQCTSPPQRLGDSSGRSSDSSNTSGISPPPLSVVCRPIKR